MTEDGALSCVMDRSVEAELGSAEFAAIAAILQAEARIQLTEAKRTLVRSRLGRRLRDQGIATYRDYVRRVETDRDERAAMIVALTTNHTHFFREGHHFDHLVGQVLPQLKERAAQGEPVRLWSAGCSSGEEPYTIAMCLLGRSRTDAVWLKDADIRVLATDLSPPVVEATRAGRYAIDAIDAVPARYRDAWMHIGPAGAEMGEAPRALVTAQVLNLFGAWPMRQLYDVIFCRNVMIYFDDSAQAELQARLVAQLKPGGYLYIGHSERIAAQVQAGVRPCGQTIYQKREDVR